MMIADRVSFTDLQSAADWVAEGQRPAGQPGRVNREHRVSGWSYPAVQLADGRVFYWRDTTYSAARWLEAPARLAESFESGPEWQVRCEHLNAVPWAPCDSEVECDQRARAEVA